MRGEVDFEGSLRERVALLEGLGEDAIDRVSARISVTPGARTFIRTLKRMGMKTAIVSAGFTRFADGLAAKLKIDYSLSNTLEMKEGVLTGRLTGDLVDGPRKAMFLREIAAAEGISTAQVVAIGDGANDLDMLSVAGLGIAFNAKPVVRERADTSVSVPYLDAVLFLMGVRRDWFLLRRPTHGGRTRREGDRRARKCGTRSSRAAPESGWREAVVIAWRQSRRGRSNRQGPGCPPWPRPRRHDAMALRPPPERR
jgi:phosphoserine phosphatase SerB